MTFTQRSRFGIRPASQHLRDAPRHALKERKLPSIERTVIYAADLELGQVNNLDTAELPRLEYDGRRKRTSEDMEVQRYAYEHFDHDVLFVPAAVDGVNSLEVPISVVERRNPLRLLINVGKGPDLGTFTVTLDGVKMGEEMDFLRAVGRGARISLLRLLA